MDKNSDTIGEAATEKSGGDSDKFPGEETKLLPSSGHDDGFLDDKSVLYRRLYNFLYPPDTPPPCQLLRLANLSIALNYLLLGILQGISAPIWTTYPLDLGATEAQQASFSSIFDVPSCMKILFGFASDAFPIFGYRRKSYQFVGWTISSLALGVILTFSNLNLDSGNTPSMPFLSFWFLIQGIGMWISDVMADTIVAEKVQFEHEEVRGRLQVTCYCFRFFGTMVAQPAAIAMYNSSVLGPESIVIFMAISPLVIYPFIWIFKEDRNIEIAPVRQQCADIYATACSRSVWQPMGFAFLYNILLLPNAAWIQYLRTVLGFTSNEINIITFVAYALLYISILSYRYFMISWSWRNIYIFATIIIAFFSGLQILLIEGVTFGLPNFLFALSDSAVQYYVFGIMYMPMIIMMAQLCPEGREGASFAMFTTVYNGSLVVNEILSTLLLGIWDVSEEALAAGYVGGILKLTILTSCLQMSGILFVWMLPKDREHLMQLKTLRSGTSKVGGTILLSIVFFVVMMAFVIGTLNIVYPSWM